MIYSKFGTRLTAVSKSNDASGRVVIQATAEATTGVRDYQITDIKADGGSAEIDELIAGLALKVAPARPAPRPRMPEVPEPKKRHPHRKREQSQFRRRKR
jgi:hypothetical protein